MATRFKGAAQGIYTCHLRHMMVKKPLNIDDEDLVDGMSTGGKPMSQPTAMSYPLLRVRLADIARSIIDRTLIIMSPAGGLSDDVVIDIDTE